MSAQTISGVGPEIAPRTGLSPQALSGSSDVNGPGIDRLGFASCKVVAKTGATTGTPTSFTVAVRLQHSDTIGSGYVDFTPSVPNPGGTGAITPLAAANAMECLAAGAIVRHYVREPLDLRIPRHLVVFIVGAALLAPLGAIVMVAAWIGVGSV